MRNFQSTEISYDRQLPDLSHQTNYSTNSKFNAPGGQGYNMLYYYLSKPTDRKIRKAPNAPIKITLSKYKRTNVLRPNLRVLKNDKRVGVWITFRLRASDMRQRRLE